MMMVDLSAIKDSPWHRILRKWRTGSVDRAAIIRALETGEAVPVRANKLLAGLLDGTIKARRGLKPAPGGVPARTVARQVAVLENLLKSPSLIPETFDSESRAALTTRVRGSATDNAHRLAAEMFGLSTRMVRDAVETNNRNLRAIAESEGVTLAQIKRKLGYGEP